MELSAESASALETWLVSKRIDSHALRQGMPLLWAKWAGLLQQSSTASLDQWAKFSINPIRRQFPLTQSPESLEPPKAEVPARPKPVIRRPVAPAAPQTSAEESR